MKSNKTDIILSTSVPCRFLGPLALVHCLSFKNEFGLESSSRIAGADSGERERGNVRGEFVDAFSNVLEAFSNLYPTVGSSVISQSVSPSVGLSVTKKKSHKSASWSAGPDAPLMER